MFESVDLGSKPKGAVPGEKVDKHAHVMFKGSRYADRITIGLPEIIKKGDRNALMR